MDYKEPKRRVTKSDKKDKKGVYTSKHIRNLGTVLHTSQPAIRTCDQM